MKLDHVHLVCRDRPAMLAWLGRVFGLVPAAAFAQWECVDGGPIFTVTPNGENALALFEAGPDHPQTEAVDHTIGFAVDALAFARLLARAGELQLFNRFGKSLSAAGATDHGLAMSLYFVSPEAHRFEVTCYDTATVKQELASA